MSPVIAPLIALAAAAIPILLHLWNQRRYRETRWAAMEFLLAAIRKNARRVRVEQVLLLLTRVAILLFLALALVTPLVNWNPPWLDGGRSGGHAHWVLVLDGSYSMLHAPGGKTRFAAAQELACQIVRDARQGDGFTLVLMSEPARVVIADPAFSPGDVIDEIEALTPPHAGADLASTLGECLQLVRAVAEKQPRLTARRVVFVTDLGAATWKDSALPGNRQSVAALADLATLRLVDVGEPNPANAAITRLEKQTALVTRGRDAQFLVEARNFGARALTDARVEFVVDGRPSHEERVTLPGGDRVTLAFTTRFEVEGEHFVEARLADDALPLDNRRWLSVPVAEAVRALCVEGKPAAARHVAAALEPWKTRQPRVRVDVAPVSALLETRLEDFDALFLCNVARFGREEARLLRRYLDGGGGVVWFLGDQTDAKNHNETLVGDDEQTRTAPARLGDVIAGEELFDPLGYRHPLVEVFRGHERGGLLTTPTWRYFQLTAVSSASAKTALAFTSGRPAIVEEPLGRGRAILVATDGSSVSHDASVKPPRAWSALAAWPSFPPLVQELLLLAAGGRDQERNALVGEEISGALPAGSAATSARVLAPDQQGAGERVAVVYGENEARWRFAETRVGGLYQTRWEDPAPRVCFHAVNLDTRESDLERFDADELPAQFQQEAPAPAAPGESAAPRAPGKDAAWSGLFRAPLLAALACLFAESLLAWWFGRR